MMRHLLAAAALLALAAPAFAASGDAEAGHKKSAPCAACHGANGVSVSPEFPNLAGQYPDYIEAALTHYKNGKRKNPIMQAQVANLSPKDILDLAAYFSRQEGLKYKH
jgi:cytochrome c553